jgi:S-methylmethionine-dependent homocysteine/selenocysteine methylase
MVIVVEGTKSFSDYELFMVGMAKALSHPMNESRIQVWTLGPHKINSFTAAFCNSSEDYLKQKGFKVSFSKVNLDWVKSNIEYVDFFGYFSLPKEPESKAMSYMQKQEGLQVGWFRY